MPRKKILKISFPLYSLFGGAAYDFSTIKNGDLFLSYPQNFNDPFDGAILIDQNEFTKEFLTRRFDERFVSIASSELQKHKSLDIFSLIDQYNFTRSNAPYGLPLYSDECSIFADIDTAKLKEEIAILYDSYIREIKKVRDEYGVACFTANAPQHNMVMWAHYANNYRGFCCEFVFDYYDADTIRDTKGTSNVLRHFHRVIYTKSFPFLNVKKLLDIPVEELHKNKYIHRFIERVLTLKHKQWNYENEYRIIIHKDSSHFKKVFDKNNKGFKISFPYLNALYLDFAKCIDDTSIEDIASKYKIKYYGLTASPNGVTLVEDKSIINSHNILLDSERILQMFSLSAPMEKETLPF